MRPWIVFPLYLFLLLAGCGEDDRNQRAVQAVIEEEVEKRVRNYKEVRMQRCYEQALQEASYLADSILLLEARLERDTMGKPPKPEKPEKPEIKTVLDSLPVKPLLDKTKKAEKDTLMKDGNGNNR
ncbi:MAG: hypothetical protein J5I94_12925 [Phaeodactylibacter sp.]|nr:hypothetical protein [Phaeodactylibacter sp.]